MCQEYQKSSENEIFYKINIELTNLCARNIRNHQKIKYLTYNQVNINPLLGSNNKIQVFTGAWHIKKFSPEFQNFIFLNTDLEHKIWKKPCPNPLTWLSILLAPGHHTMRYVKPSQRTIAKSTPFQKGQSSHSNWVNRKMNTCLYLVLTLINFKELNIIYSLIWLTSTTTI